MGACSSKPKTTEFEGSTEPVQKAEDAVVERNADAALAVSQENEQAKGKDGAVNAGDETKQLTHELIAHEDKAPVVKESSSTAEGASYSDGRELSAVDGGAGEGAVEKAGQNVPDSQKADVSDGTPEDKEVSDKCSGDGGNGGGDQGKLFEDKAVLNESRNSDLEKEGVCVDKEVAAGEDRAHESSNVVGSNTADESRNLQVAQEARGIGSPIVGVVHVSEPHRVDEVPDCLSLETPQSAAPINDSTASESLDEASLAGQHRGEDAVSSAEEVANLSSGWPQEAPEVTEEVLHDDLKSSHPSASAFNDGEGRKSEVGDANQGEEVPPASADVQDERAVEDTAKPDTTLVSHNDSEEKPSLPQKESVPVERATESAAAGTENGGNSIPLDEPELAAPNVHENFDEGTHVKPSAETEAEDAGEGQAEGTVDEPNETDVSPRDFKGEVVKPEAASALASAEPIIKASSQMDRDETDKPLIEAPMMNGEKVNDADAGIKETAEQKKKTPAEGDLAFEDASDVPSRVEPSTEVGR